MGSGVTGLSAGDRVVVNPLVDPGQLSAFPPEAPPPPPRFMGSASDGSYAEYVTVPAVNAHPIADGVSFEQAAASPTTFLPVWNMMVRRAQLKPWETVLVLSASAGVGTAAIQTAKNVVGARVIATTSTAEKAAQARSLGADEVINYTEEDIAERVKALTGGQGVDVVVDHVGAEFFTAAFNSLRPGGPLHHLRGHHRPARRASPGAAVHPPGRNLRRVYGHQRGYAGDCADAGPGRD